MSTQNAKFPWLRCKQVIEVVFGVCLIFAIVFSLWYHSSTKVGGTLFLTIYEDGQPVGETQIRFQGSFCKHPWGKRAPRYAGTYSIDAVPETCPSGKLPAPQAGISWVEDYQFQRLRYFSDGLVCWYGLTRFMTNEEMSEAAVTLPDGRIAATSAEWYRIYWEYVSAPYCGY